MTVSDVLKSNFDGTLIETQISESITNINVLFGNLHYTVTDICICFVEAVNILNKTITEHCTEISAFTIINNHSLINKNMLFKALTL